MLQVRKTLEIGICYHNMSLQVQTSSHLHGVSVGVWNVVVSVNLLADHLIEDAFAMRQAVRTEREKPSYIIKHALMQHGRELYDAVFVEVVHILYDAVFSEVVERVADGLERALRHGRHAL